MCDADLQDDEILEVPRKVGRPVRSMANPYERGSEAHAPKCHECPKWLRETSVCLFQGGHQAGASPACKYGIVLIRAKRMADRRAAGKSTDKKEQ